MTENKQLVQDLHAEQVYTQRLPTLLDEESGNIEMQSWLLWFMVIKMRTKMGLQHVLYTLLQVIVCVYTA